MLFLIAKRKKKARKGRKEGRKGTRIPYNWEMGRNYNIQIIEYYINTLLKVINNMRISSYDINKKKSKN